MKTVLWLALAVFSSGSLPASLPESVPFEEEGEAAPRAPRDQVRRQRLAIPALPPAPPRRPSSCISSLNAPSFSEHPGPWIARFRLRSPSA